MRAPLAARAEEVDNPPRQRFDVLSLALPDHHDGPSGFFERTNVPDVAGAVSFKFRPPVVRPRLRSVPSLARRVVVQVPVTAVNEHDLPPGHEYQVGPSGQFHALPV